MNALISEASRWLWDYLLLATLLLTAILIANKFIAQPAKRMAVHWSATAGLFLLGLMCAVPGWSVVHMISAPAQTPIPAIVAIASPENELLADQIPIPLQQPAFQTPDYSVTSNALPDEVMPTPTAPAEVIENATPFDYSFWSLVLMGLGSMVSMLWLALGSWQVHRLRTFAQPALPQLKNLLAELARNEHTPELGIAKKLPVAVAVGLRRPMILLPQSNFEQQRTEKLETVLAHELAHIRHRDLWMLALLRGLLLALWPHPLYWLWRRNVRLDQETLADASAADVTNRTDYAEQLVAWARLATEVRAPRLASSVGLWENPSQLKRRIAILLDDKLTVLRACSRRWSFCSATLLLLMAGALSTVTLQPGGIAVAEPSTDVLEDMTPLIAMQGFSNGATVEVLAIGTHALPKQQWWNADGNALSRLSFEAKPANNISPLPNRQIVFRVRGLGQDANVIWRTQPSSNSSEGTVIVDGQKNPPGYYCHVFEKPKQDKELTLRVGIAAGEWATVASGTRSGTSLLNKSVVISGALSDGQGNSVAVISHNYRRNADTRGIAIDKSGKQHIAVTRRGASAGDQNQTEWKFVGLAPEDVRSFALQVRPYEWVEFRDLPTVPTLSRENEAQTSETIPPITEKNVQTAIDVLLQPNLIEPAEQWGRAVQTLVEVGPPALPYLIEALDAEKRDHPIRKLVFTLRAIGDKRAIPALIRAIPRTHQPPASDYGLEVKDEALKAFLQQHDSENDGNLLTYGRALAEVFRTLHLMSGGESFGEMDLIFVHKQGSRAQQQQQQELFVEVANRWADWWENNWQNHLPDSLYSKVGLPKQVTKSAINLNQPVRFPVGEKVHLTKGSDGVLISPNQMRHPDSLLDLDTNRQGTLPRQFSSVGRHDKLSAKLLAWCSNKGFDLIGFVEINETNQSQSYGVRMLGLQAWAISEAEIANLPKAMAGEIPYPLDNEVQEMIPRHSQAGPYEQVTGTPYLFKTREGTYGLIRLHEPGGFPYPSANGSIQYFVETDQASETDTPELTIVASRPEVLPSEESLPAWSIHGRVTDDAGKGLSGVEVRAATGIGTLLGGGKTTTDDEGNYQLNFGPGMRTTISEETPMGVGTQAASISVSKSGWSEKSLCQAGNLLMTDHTEEQAAKDAANWGHSSVESVFFPHQPKLVNFQMQPSATLKGEFSESSHKWKVKEVNISITGPKLPPSCSVLTTVGTDKYGKFRIEDLPVNEEWKFTMRVEGSDIDVESQPFRLNKAGRHRCRLVLEDQQSDAGTPKLTLRVEGLEQAGGPAGDDFNLSTATPPADDEQPLSLDFVAATPPADSDESKTADSVPNAKTAKAVDARIKLMRSHYQRLHEKLKPNTILGICLDEKGQPLAGVPVQVFSRRMDGSEDNPRPIFETESNAQGEFTFSNVVDIAKDYPEGLPEEIFQGSKVKVFNIQGRLAGRVPGIGSNTEINLARNGHAMVWVMSPAKTLRGRVTNDQGQPVAGAKVDVGYYASQGGSHGINSATTDALGEYVIDDLASENRSSLDQALFVTHPKYAMRRAKLPAIPGKLDVQLTPGSIIEGNVAFPANGLFAEKAPFTGGMARLQRVMPDPKPGDKPGAYDYQVLKASIDTRGHYRFKSLPAGKYHLTADINGWVTQGLENVEVARGKTTIAPDIELKQGGRVQVQLVDNKTGQPMRFDKPTKGYLNAQSRPQRADIFMFPDNIVDFSPEGTTEIVVPAGQYTFHASVPKPDGGSGLTTVLPDSMDEWPTETVVDGQLLTVALSLESQKPPTSGDGELSFFIQSTPSDETPEQESSKENKSTDGFVPATPPATGARAELQP